MCPGGGVYVQEELSSPGGGVCKSLPGVVSSFCCLEMSSLVCLFAWIVGFTRQITLIRVG